MEWSVGAVRSAIPRSGTVADRASWRSDYDRVVEFVLVLAVALAVILVLWALSTVSRLNRLGTRTGVARSSLDAQLVRRAAAASALAEHAPIQHGAALDPVLAARLRTAARQALEADAVGQELAENELSRVLAALPADLDPDLLRDLADASTRVTLARRFYNDAVRDTASLRSRRLTRLFRLAAHRPAPAFFEIADAAPPKPRAPRAPVETG